MWQARALSAEPRPTHLLCFCFDLVCFLYCCRIKVFSYCATGLAFSFAINKLGLPSDCLNWVANLLQVSNRLLVTGMCTSTEAAVCPPSGVEFGTRAGRGPSSLATTHQPRENFGLCQETAAKDGGLSAGSLAWPQFLVPPVPFTDGGGWMQKTGRWQSKGLQSYSQKKP